MALGDKVSGFSRDGGFNCMNVLNSAPSLLLDCSGLLLNNLVLVTILGNPYQLLYIYIRIMIT